MKNATTHWVFLLEVVMERDTCKINVRTLDQMAVGNSQLKNQRFLLEPSWLGESQEKQGLGTRSPILGKGMQGVSLKVRL